MTFESRGFKLKICRMYQMPFVVLEVSGRKLTKTFEYCSIKLKMHKMYKISLNLVVSNMYITCEIEIIELSKIKRRHFF